MKFGEVPVREAAGGILAHSIRCSRRTLKKGLLLEECHVAELEEADVAAVTVAELESGDVHEDEAAKEVARALAGDHVDVQAAFTGRANIVATSSGIATLDAGILDAVNGIDEAVTVATLPAFEPVAANRMVATIKIIPFAVAEEILDACLGAAEASGRAIAVAPFRGYRASLVMTVTDAVKPTVLDRTAEVVAARIDGFGLAIGDTARVPHRTRDLARIIVAQAEAHDLVLVYGASAITDRRDVVPAAIEAAGGSVDHLGMPVDPGNLLLVGRVGETTVLGLPGCARSPKLNGLDLVLGRLSAGLEVTGRDIMTMGVGGLLKEIPSRPRPRETGPRVADRKRMPGAIVLAAGRSRRMGGRNKLLLEIGGKPMVCHVVDALLDSGIASITVVTGHQAQTVRSVLRGSPVSFVENSDHAAGLSTSLKAGLDAIPASCGAVLVCLGDMPAVDGETLRALTRAWQRAEGPAIVVPTRDGRLGNPVLWDRSFFSAMREVTGDTGARHLIGEYQDCVVEVAMDNRAVLLDIDTPEDFDSALKANVRRQAAENREDNGQEIVS